MSDSVAHRWGEYHREQVVCPTGLGLRVGGRPYLWTEPEGGDDPTARVLPSDVLRCDNGSKRSTGPTRAGVGPATICDR